MTTSEREDPYLELGKVVRSLDSAANLVDLEEAREIPQNDETLGEGKEEEVRHQQEPTVNLESLSDDDDLSFEVPPSF